MNDVSITLCYIWFYVRSGQSLGFITHFARGLTTLRAYRLVLWGRHRSPGGEREIVEEEERQERGREGKVREMMRKKEGRKRERAPEAIHIKHCYSSQATRGCFWIWEGPKCPVTSNDVMYWLFTLPVPPTQKHTHIHMHTRTQSCTHTRALGNLGPGKCQSFQL